MRSESSVRKTKATASVGVSSGNVIEKNCLYLARAVNFSSFVEVAGDGGKSGQKQERHKRGSFPDFHGDDAGNLIFGVTGPIDKPATQAEPVKEGVKKTLYGQEPTSIPRYGLKRR